MHLKPHFCLKAKVKVNRKLWDVSSKVCNPRFQKQRPCCEYPWLSGIKLWLPHFPSLLQSPSQDWLSPSVSVSLMPGPSVHTSRLLHQASCREPCFCCLIVLIAMWYYVFSYFLSLLSPLLYTLASYFNWFICNCFIKNILFCTCIAAYQNSNCSSIVCITFLQLLLLQAITQQYVLSVLASYLYLIGGTSSV